MAIVSAESGDEFIRLTTTGRMPRNVQWVRITLELGEVVMVEYKRDRSKAVTIDADDVERWFGVPRADWIGRTAKRNAPIAARTHSQRTRSRRDSDRAYDRTRRRSDPALREAQRFRSSARWQRFRDWFKRVHPLCVDPFGYHREDGKAQAAEHVHHIVPLVESIEDACDEANCMAVCAACHARLEAGLRRKGG